MLYILIIINYKINNVLYTRANTITKKLYISCMNYISKLYQYLLSVSLKRELMAYEEIRFYFNFAHRKET